jgi:hypothetical protein
MINLDYPKRSSVKDLLSTCISSLSAVRHQVMLIQTPCLVVGRFENGRTTHRSLGRGDDGKIFTGYTEEDFHDDGRGGTLGPEWRILELLGVSLPGFQTSAACLSKAHLSENFLDNTLSRRRTWTDDK